MFNTEDDKIQFQSDLISLILDVNPDFDAEDFCGYRKFLDTCSETWDLVECVEEDQFFDREGMYSTPSVTTEQDNSYVNISDIDPDAVEDAMFVDPDLGETPYIGKISSITVLFA